MDTGFAEGIRVYPARIIQVDLDERDFVRALRYGRHDTIQKDTSQKG
jgi:hypothetical protein